MSVVGNVWIPVGGQLDVAQVAGLASRDGGLLRARWFGGGGVIAVINGQPVYRDGQRLALRFERDGGTLIEFSVSSAEPDLDALLDLRMGRFFTLQWSDVESPNERQLGPAGVTTWQRLYQIDA